MTPEQFAERVVWVSPGDQGISSTLMIGEFAVDDYRDYEIGSLDSDVASCRAAVASAIREALAAEMVPPEMRGGMRFTERDAAETAEAVKTWTDGADVMARRVFMIAGRLHGAVVKLLQDRDVMLALLRDLSADGSLAHYNAGWNAAVEAAAEKAEQAEEGIESGYVEPMRVLFDAKKVILELKKEANP